MRCECVWLMRQLIFPDMVCYYAMILYEKIESYDNEHTFQAYDISEVSGTRIQPSTNGFLTFIFVLILFPASGFVQIQDIESGDGFALSFGHTEP